MDLAVPPGCNGGPCPVSCRCVNSSHFAPAVAAAAKADIVIFVGGASALAEWMEGEAADKTDLNWPGQQEALAKAVKHAAGAKPFIVAMAHGSPLVSEWSAPHHTPFCRACWQIVHQSHQSNQRIRAECAVVSWQGLQHG